MAVLLRGAGDLTVSGRAEPGRRGPWVFAVTVRRTADRSGSRHPTGTDTTVGDRPAFVVVLRQAAGYRGCSRSTDRDGTMTRPAGRRTVDAC